MARNHVIVGSQLLVVHGYLPPADGVERAGQVAAEEGHRIRLLDAYFDKALFAVRVLNGDQLDGAVSHDASQCGDIPDNRPHSNHAHYGPVSYTHLTLPT